MAQSAVSTVLGSVGNLAFQETKLLCGVSLEVGLLKDELMRLQAYLKDADSKWRSGNARVKILVIQIRATVYEAQNIIEAVDYLEKRNRLKKGFMGAISRYARLPSDLVSLHKVGSQIQHVRRKLNEIFQSADRLKIDMDNTVVVSDQLEVELAQDYGPFYQNYEDDFVVGFQDEYQEIVDKLVHGGEKLSVVSIVAMGGAGKTTLARKVCASSIVQQHFDKIAWVIVSQKFKGVDLLKDILKQIIEDKDKLIDKMQEHEVRMKIKDFLSQQKYLVVLDDVWEEDTWDQINGRVKTFPDAANGSKILLTTRKERVANHVEMPTHVHVLKELDEEKSWELFNSKALPEYRRCIISDMGQFEELGRLLARKCDGLPLALTVLGGYLSKNINIEAWTDMMLCWPSTRNTQMMHDILARSYKDMTDNYLRSCFLYLASFPEDHIIDVSILITLWIAEGFIPHRPRHEPEQTAQKYLAELAQRNLVQVTAINQAHGCIVKIRVHDILRDWCIEEARNDGFLDVNEGQVGAPSIDTMTSYRSSYQDFGDHNFHATPNLRTLIGFRFPQVTLPNHRFLRVLHIENSILQNLSSAIEGCIHLRCLGLINCGDVTLPSSIGKFLYLQTVDMRQTRSLVPESLWGIPSLRRVNLFGRVSLPKGVQQKELQNFVLQDNLSLNNYLDMVRFLGQMTRLVTLSLDYARITAEVMNIFENMPRLVDVHLSRLSAFDRLPEFHLFPQRLRSLTLVADGIKQDPMPVLEMLLHLVLLRLEGYIGRTMSCSAWGFPQLQHLELYSFSNVEVWNIGIGTMPKLAHLRLYEFIEMSNVPRGLLNLPSLNHLELAFTPMISIYNNSTLMELQQQGCEVITQYA